MLLRNSSNQQLPPAFGRGGGLHRLWQVEHYSFKCRDKRVSPVTSCGFLENTNLRPNDSDGWCTIITFERVDVPRVTAAWHLSNSRGGVDEDARAEQARHSFGWSGSSARPSRYANKPLFSRNDVEFRAEAYRRVQKDNLGSTNKYYICRWWYIHWIQDLKYCVQ